MKTLLVLMLRTVREKAEIAMIVGHNPGLELVVTDDEDNVVPRPGVS